ncbi:MAG: hypothetical protein H0W64_02190 [Gammaproteobacteria bacterium]|nr:hypothetical protein [Gammaproteobacteria bacterium]
MRRKGRSDLKDPPIKGHVEDFKILLRYINHLANHKLGYPVSLLTYLGVVDNKILGIEPNSLANVLLNNVGDPFKDSETSLMEVKKHERDLISILERHYGLKPQGARGYVTTGGTEGNFAGLWWSKRFLINSALPKLINSDDQIKIQLKEELDLTVALGKISKTDHKLINEYLQKIIDLKNTVALKRNTVQQLLTPTVFFTKGHTHYSIPKISEILHLNIRPVEANKDGSMNLESFKKELILNRGAYPESAIVVIANIGTTITGAIDDVPGIYKILRSLPHKPFFTIHLDGALTGFVMPVIKPFGEVENYFGAIGVNTLAVSAHKYPGLSQPCGILLARKEFFAKAFEKSERSIDYVGNILDVTITGSRSGLNVLMFYNALHSLGLHKDQKKLTRMVQENLARARYLYQRLKEIYGADEVYYPYHFNVIFPRPSNTIAKKYQLMLTGDRATICVLTNVTKELIDQFIIDLQLDKEVYMNKKVLDKSDLSIETLTPAHAKSTTDLLVRSFCDSEPITKSLNIAYEDYEPFVKEVVQKATKEGLSKVAVDKQNRVIACTIAEDLSDPFIPKIAHYPRLRPVFALIEELSRPFTGGKKFLKGKIAHVWIAAVDPEFRGQHLFVGVDMACIENAARKGYDFAYAEFTNPVSENVTHQFSVLQLCNRINLKDFKLGNQQPFEEVEGAATSYVAAIRPGVKLDALERVYTIEEVY